MSGYAAIFDFDGVIVLSARLHELSWAQLAANHGYPPLSVSRIGSLGVKTEYVITELLRWTNDAETVRRLSIEKEALFRDMVRQVGIDPVPGIEPFVRRLYLRGVPMAIGSSAPRENIETCLEALGLRDAFSAIVTGNDVKRGKPEPDIFLAAAQRLEVAPASCVVFEDAPAGIAAARAAGMRVIGVLTAHAESDLAGADRFVRDFTELIEDDPFVWTRGKLLSCSERRGLR